VENLKNKLRFYATFVNYNGKPALLIRTFVVDKEEMKRILVDTYKKGSLKIEGILIFRNPQMAILKAKELQVI